jgi:hypothetical protein
MTVSSARAHTGTRSLFTLRVSGQRRQFLALLSLCINGGNFANATQESIWFYVDGPPLDINSYVVPYAGGNLGSGGPLNPPSATAGSWQSATLPLAPYGLVGNIGISGFVAGTSDWTGTIYVDDISVR